MSLHPESKRSKVTWPHLQTLKQEGRRFSVLTAYDFSTARCLDQAGVEVVLVGDSLAMTALGHASTLEVTLEEMLHHTRAVARGVSSALLLGDAPFGTYGASVEQGIQTAVRFLKEGQAEGVKLEGASEVVLETCRHLSSMGIPVVGHLGLTPQSVHQVGGFRLQAKTAESAKQLLQDALALEASGVRALVLELVPLELAQRVTKALRIPTIGIGAGPHCDAQVLVTDDLLQRFQGHKPRFVRHYASIGDQTIEAATRFKTDVLDGRYPSPEESFSVPSLSEIETTSIQ
jgi:3-methyl-2-oxobutanoate hydroxymethyltransferase